MLVCRGNVDESKVREQQRKGRRQQIKESQRHRKRDTEEVKGNVKAIII